MAKIKSMSSFFVDHLYCNTAESIQAVFFKLCTEFGFSNITYFGLALPNTKFGEDILITTYNNEWKMHYFDSGYKQLDPILSLGVKSLLPLDWSYISINNLKLKNFFGEAIEFGVGRHGLTIPVRGIHSEIALFSVNSEIKVQEWSTYSTEMLSDLTYLAHLVHDRVLKNQLYNMPQREKALTPREREVLRWAANGKTAWETSKILGLSEKTISFYISNATIKLGVATKTQAVAKALAEKLILL